MHEGVGEAFHIVGARPRVYDVADARFILQVQLRVACDTGREVCGQRNGLVEGVGVQALRVAEGRAHGFDAGARDVVEGVLLGERPSAGLRVRAQRETLRILRVELFDDFRPQHSGGTHLGNFHEVVFADGPEEGEARRELVYLEAGLFAFAEVFETVREGVGHFEVRRGARFLHVVAGNRDAVELRHVLRGVREDVADDLHRGRRGVDVGVAHHELLENVVLDGARELFKLRALFEARDDVERENRKDRAVHGHRNRYLRKRDFVEQHLHVHDGVYRDARLADVADDARVVGVVAAVRGQVERD